jgi:hypothetical protein
MAIEQAFEHLPCVRSRRNRAQTGWWRSAESRATVTPTTIADAREEVSRPL